MGRILIVDDEPHMRRILVSNLRLDQHETWEAAGVEEARRHLAASDYDAVFTDQKMPDGEGLEVLSELSTFSPSLSSLRSSAPPLGVLASRHGYAAKTSCSKGQWFALKVHRRFTGKAQALSLCARRSHASRQPMPTVLITGETGTGKELVARAVHHSSPRSAKPFVAVNCAAFTETLLDSELFGHEKGAFTGADRSRQWLFEAAHEGTLFLDEAGEMSLAAQAKLLRILTDGELIRAGSTKPRTVDVRVLVATHRDLEQRVREGTFRQDLYYRLAVVPIHIPPLRERRDDIPGLCEMFSCQIATELKLPQRSISATALQSLTQYDFPGNVRELRNLFERAYILSGQDEIGPENFPVAVASDVPVTVNNNGHQDSSHLPSPESPEQPFDLTAFLEKDRKRAHPQNPGVDGRRSGRGRPSDGSVAQRASLQVDQVRHQTCRRLSAECPERSHHDF